MQRPSDERLTDEMRQLCALRFRSVSLRLAKHRMLRWFSTVLPSLIEAPVCGVSRRNGMTLPPTIFQLSQALVVAAFVALVAIPGSAQPSTLTAANTAHPASRTEVAHPFAGRLTSVSLRGDQDRDQPVALDPEVSEREGDEEEASPDMYALTTLLLESLPLFSYSTAKHSVGPAAYWVSSLVPSGHHPRGPPTI